MYGLSTNKEGGGSAPAMKPTKFLTNSAPMAKLLGKRCDRSHEHQPLISGRCAQAAFYPIKLVRTILRGIRDTRTADQNRLEKLSALITDVEDLKDLALAVTDTVVTARVKVSKVGGGYLELEWDERNFKEIYRDEYTGEVLPTRAD